MHVESETVRVQAFSDAVFAIAMTLLVIEIKVPSHEVVAANGLARSLIALWRYASLRLLSPTASIAKKAEAAQVTKQHRYGPPLYFAIFGVSFVSEALSVALCLFGALFFAYQSSPVKR